MCLECLNHQVTDICLDRIGSVQVLCQILLVIQREGHKNVLHEGSPGIRRRNAERPETEGYGCRMTAKGFGNSAEGQTDTIHPNNVMVCRLSIGTIDIGHERLH